MAAQRVRILQTLAADFIAIAVILIGWVSDVAFLVYLGIAVLAASFAWRTYLWHFSRTRKRR